MLFVWEIWRLERETGRHPGNRVDMARMVVLLGEPRREGASLG